MQLGFKANRRTHHTQYLPVYPLFGLVLFLLLNLFSGHKILSPEHLSLCMLYGLYWNIRTKTQLLFKRFIWAILTNWSISDKAGPFWRQLPTPANALCSTYINHSSPKVLTSKCPLIFLHLFLLLLSRVSNYIAFTVNLFSIPHNLHDSELSLNRNLILKHFIVPIAFSIFPTSVKKCPYSKHINIWQYYKLATTIF